MLSSVRALACHCLRISKVTQLWTLFYHFILVSVRALGCHDQGFQHCVPDVEIHDHLYQHNVQSVDIWFYFGFRLISEIPQHQQVQRIEDIN